MQTQVPGFDLRPMSSQTNVKDLVPLLAVSSMERSLRFYTAGLGFALQRKWVVEGKIRWCWLALGGAALMLQEFFREGQNAWVPKGQVGDGVSFNFQCVDALALYHEFRSRELDASEPEVGNSLWVTSLVDPDGYRLFFASATDVPEDTKLSEMNERTTFLLQGE